MLHALVVYQIGFFSGSLHLLMSAKRIANLIFVEGETKTSITLCNLAVFPATFSYFPPAYIAADVADSN